MNALFITFYQLETNMKQELLVHNETDAQGNPAGGHVSSIGLSISWQNGPLNVSGERAAPNGCFVETVIAAAISRLEYYQQSKFACEYNVKALEQLYAAMTYLEARTADREKRGVEGTHQQ